MPAPRPEGRRRARALGALAATLVVLASVLVTGWWTSGDDTGFGAALADTGPAASAEPTAQPTARPTTTAVPGPAGAAPAPAPVGRRSATPQVLPDPAGPVRLDIPELGVSAAVVPVGVEESGAMELPGDPAVVGWYRWGPVPGAPGRAVLAGHVDTRSDGPGALFDLRTAAPGTVVRLTFADGAVREFTVDGRRNYGKEELPTAEVFARSGPPELLLITCGGEFDSTAGTYEENVVVSAEG